MSEPYCTCGHCLSAHATRYDTQPVTGSMIRSDGGYCLICGWGNCPRFQEGEKQSDALDLAVSGTVASKGSRS